MELSKVRHKVEFHLVLLECDIKGRAVVVRNKMVKSVICVSDCLMSANLKAVPVDISVVQVYMPTPNHEVREVEHIYDEIENMLY